MSDLLTTQATTTETEALPENPNSSETKENSQGDDAKGPVDNFRGLSVDVTPTDESTNKLPDSVEGAGMVVKRAVSQLFSEKGVSPGTQEDLKEGAVATGKIFAGVTAKVVANTKQGGAGKVILDRGGEVLLADGITSAIVTGEKAKKRITAIHKSEEDGESGGIDVPSPLEEIGDTFGLAISTLSSVLLLIFNNAPEGRFEGLLYFISLALILQCIHYIYNQFFTFLFKILNKGMARTNVDEKKLSNKE